MHSIYLRYKDWVLISTLKEGEWYKFNYFKGTERSLWSWVRDTCFVQRPVEFLLNELKRGVVHFFFYSLAVWNRWIFLLLHIREFEQMLHCLFLIEISLITFFFRQELRCMYEFRTKINKQTKIPKFDDHLITFVWIYFNLIS